MQHQQKRASWCSKIKQEQQPRRAKAVELSRQGARNLLERKITWAELWRMEPFRLSLMLRSVYDTLSCPSNLHQWGLIEELSCKLCGRRGTMTHILLGCEVALTQGRYRWRHDKVLKYVTEILDIEKKRRDHQQQRQSRSDSSKREIQVMQKSHNILVNAFFQPGSQHLDVDMNNNYMGIFINFNVSKSMNIRNAQDFLIPGIDYNSRIWHNVLEILVLNALQLCTCFVFLTILIWTSLISLM